MTKSIRSYSDDFKKEAISLALRSGSVNEIADNLGMPRSALHGWSRGISQSNASPNSSTMDPHEELKRMRKEIAQLKEERKILKKAAALFCEGIQVKYRFIRKYQACFSVSKLCGVLKVSGSGYYDGYRRIYHHLKAENVVCSQNRIQRVTQASGIKARCSKAYKGTTLSKHQHPIAPNFFLRFFGGTSFPQCL